ncbi:hypothetical protein LX36DRAFT_664888 [Colletotrichum falcatum]|nr:hypothetical protein LX36DRAFT_664888 [Colletotrichum falcatum]
MQMRMPRGSPLPSSKAFTVSAAPRRVSSKPGARRGPLSRDGPEGPPAGGGERLSNETSAWAWARGQGRPHLPIAALRLSRRRLHLFL